MIDSGAACGLFLFLITMIAAIYNCLGWSMLRAKVLETMLYGSVTWSPRACHCDTLRRAHHRFLTRCIGWLKNSRAGHPISYLDALIKTGSESIEATLRKRRNLFVGFVARMEDTRRPST